MAPPQPSHLSLASSTHRPSITTLLIIISVALVPFLALSSSELCTFPNIVITLWDSLLGIATSSPFYFFLLNFLIVALVYSSGVLDPSSKRQDSADELQDGDPPQGDFYSAAHIIQERLAFDEFYGSQAQSPSYLRLNERPNVYVADEEHNDDGITKPATSIFLQNLAFTDMDASDTMIFSPSKAHSTNALKNIKLDVIAGSMTRDALAVSPVSFISVNDHIADVQDETIFHVDKYINVQNVQVCDEDHHEARNVREEAEDGADNGKTDNGVNCGSGDADQSGVNIADNDVKGKHNVHDGDGVGDDDDDGEECDAGTQRSHTLIAQTAQTHQMMGRAVEQGNVGDEESKLDEDVSAINGRDPSEEEAGERQESRAGGEGEMALREEVQMMSREELNERASAFISAFRRKLISTAIVDD